MSTLAAPAARCAEAVSRVRSLPVQSTTRSTSWAPQSRRVASDVERDRDLVAIDDESVVE